MRFTEAEAQAQVGKWVRVRDDALWRERITQGTLGEVVGAQLPQREDGAIKEEGWGVCIEFYLSRDHCVHVLIRDIGKEQYESAFEEIDTGRVPPFKLTRAAGGAPTVLAVKP
jgi:hypothetical protein